MSRPNSRPASALPVRRPTSARSDQGPRALSTLSGGRPSSAMGGGSSRPQRPGTAPLGGRSSNTPRSRPQSARGVAGTLPQQQAGMGPGPNGRLPLAGPQATRAIMNAQGAQSGEDAKNLYMRWKDAGAVSPHSFMGALAMFASPSLQVCDLHADFEAGRRAHEEPAPEPGVGRQQQNNNQVVASRPTSAPGGGREWRPGSARPASGPSKPPMEHWNAGPNWRPKSARPRS